MKEGGGRVEAMERDMVCGGDGMRVRGVSIIRCMATSCVDMNQDTGGVVTGRVCGLQVVRSQSHERQLVTVLSSFMGGSVCL